MTILSSIPAPGLTLVLPLASQLGDGNSNTMKASIPYVNANADRSKVHDQRPQQAATHSDKGCHGHGRMHEFK